METFSNAIKCKQCRCVLESPVLLPCGHSACKKHENERNAVVCFECDTEYEVPREGFSECKALAQVIASGIYKIDLGPEHKNAINACDKLKEIIEEIDQLVKDPIFYIHEQIGELKMRIDMAREEFKMKIDEEADNILRNLESYESVCKDNLKSSNTESHIKNIESELEVKKRDLDKWTKFFDNFNIDYDECVDTHNECKDSIDKLEDQLYYFQQTLLMNKFSETKLEVIDFEKIGIPFDYNSPIKGECYATIQMGPNVDEMSDTANCLVVLLDGTLISGNVDGSITIWDSDTQTRISVINGHSDIINCLKELSDGSLASASSDNTIKIWNSQSGELLRSLENHNNGVFTLEQLSDGYLASGSKDSTIKIWNVENGELLKTIEIGEAIYSLVLLRDGNLACVSESKFIILNITTEKFVRTIQEQYYTLLLLSDGSLAVSEQDSHNITIWDVDSWKLLRTLRSHKALICSMALLANGSIVSGSNDGEIMIWNPINGQLLKKIKYDSEEIYSICQLYNGCLVTVSSDCKFWE